ncbi:hypothetical protein P3T35_003151 [Kitasatospora sp. GP30]|uniref:hypothetical protein n=1 Tax=Kitasatospora sp. GP30 TaxID=3035084 RepID=UPI000CABB698|nr:hypothetical protein [Kitasatospora sp. GP30]MDH6141138.1 hypothetical protein [Kitasatospora sp. GP30]
MIEPQPRPGDIGLTSITGTVGWLIRLGQWLNGDGFAPYEHAFIVIGPGADGRQCLVEAQPGGARIGLLDEFSDRHVEYVAPAGLTDAQRVRIVHAAVFLAVARTPYSFLDYLALAAHRFRLPIPGLRRYVADSGHLICSQLADEAYRRAGVQLFADGRWPGYITPADLWQRLGRSMPIPGAVVGFPPHWGSDLVAHWLTEFEERGERQ